MFFTSQRLRVSANAAHCDRDSVMVTNRLCFRGCIWSFSWPCRNGVIYNQSVPTTVHGAPAANTFAVYGTGRVKDLTELVPGILNQLGPDSLASLRKLAESYQAIQQVQQRAGAGGVTKDDDDDEFPPNLVESFDVPDEAPATEAKSGDLEDLN